MPQSALHAAGPAAEKIVCLWWVMCAAFTAVFVLVLVLLAIGLFRKPAGDRDTPPLGRTGFIVAGGIVLPVVVLLPLLIYSLVVSAALAGSEEDFTIRVVGRQWWWEVHYPDHGIVTANEIHIPVGRPVRLELLSADVIHSFWAPSLHGKRDLIPGKPNTFRIQADRAGVFRGQCGEYCGTQHARMAFLVVALPRAEFDEWAAVRQAERLKRTPPPGEPEPRGLQVFRRANCHSCHTVAGVAGANGQVGPDLTHIGSRRTLGAATLPNTRGHLAGWVGDSQALKPGVKMPVTYLGSDDLLALVEYLEGLK